MASTIKDINGRTFPGDKLIPFPRKIVTHSIIINAPTENVWQWLVQLGSGRAGWYSYDRIDNGGMPSAMKIIPELQNIEVGDILPAIPNTKDAFIILEIQIGKALILVAPIETAVENANAKERMKGPIRVSWALILETLNHNRTVLISRGRISTDWLASSPQANYYRKRTIFIERVYKLMAKTPWFLILPIAMTGHYFMESRMLRGIKSRAESHVNE